MGVKVTVATNYGLNMNNLDFSSIWYAYDSLYNANLFRVFYSNGLVEEFRGKGFQYDAYGIPNGGVTSSYAALYAGQKLYSIDGASIAATAIVNASLTYSTSDDFKIIKDELAGADTFSGGGFSDLLFTFGGNDVLAGNGGADILYAGTGNDKITGGLGADKMFGEAGADRFIFKSIKDSTVAIPGRDTIYDFTSSDRIDLSAIDASTKSAGNQAFHFIGTAAFTGHTGELRYVKGASDTYIYADTNGDKTPDMAIHLDDAVTMKSGYFIL